MTYVTKRGEFDSLQMLRAAYLESSERERYHIAYHGAEWDNTILHASDVGSCPRKVMYRLRGTPEKPRSAKSKANRAVMYHAGYVFHFLTYSALNWAGILEGYEIPAAPRDGWEGHMDALIRPNVEKDTLIGFDEKTVLPNALKYSWDMPKAKDQLQVATYCLTQPFHWGLIEYTDRAGSNSPEECSFDARDWMDKAVDAMDALEMWQREDELPPMLDQVYVPHYSGGVLSSVSRETPWDCRYCDYHLTRKERRVNPNSGRMKEYGWTQPGSVCTPVNLPPLTVAERKNGRWTFKDESDELDRFLAAQPKTVEVREDDE